MGDIVWAPSFLGADVVGTSRRLGAEFFGRVCFGRTRLSDMVGRRKFWAPSFERTCLDTIVGAQLEYLGL